MFYLGMKFFSYGFFLYYLRGNPIRPQSRGLLLLESGIFFTQSAQKTREVAQNIKHKTRVTNADPDLNPAF
jgi:hypothetical protein